MKVLIVGSMHDEDAASKKDEFITACREIGAALGQAKFDLVVGSDSPRVADRYVMEGLSTVEGSHNVSIIRPEGDIAPYRDAPPPANGKLNVSRRRVRGSWSAGRVPQILNSDAVVLIGGGKSTLACGHIAPALNRPVVAVASFGGAAKALWPLLEPYYRRLGPVSDKIDALQEQWKSNNADIIVEAIRELVGRRVFQEQPRLPLGIYMIALVFGLVAWVCLFTNPFSNASYSFFGMLGLAGLLGTILRNNLRMVFDPTAVFSWNELLIEVGAGLLLSFALALLYLIGAITVTGKTDVILTDTTEGFQRVAVIMTLLGLCGGLMIEQAADRVRGWFTEKLKSEKT